MNAKITVETPKGYRRLKKGEPIKSGDKVFWTPTPPGKYPFTWEDPYPDDVKFGNRAEYPDHKIVIRRKGNR